MGVIDLLFNHRKDILERNLTDGRIFMAENAEREGVVTLDSGLQYRVIKEGDGRKPKATDSVKCHYHGTNIKGEIFDSSIDRGLPATFPLDRVIKGWTEGLQLMSEGSKYEFVIPPHLAYGKQKLSKEIGPNSTLIFEVELIEIVG